MDAGQAQACSGATAVRRSDGTSSPLKTCCRPLRAGYATAKPCGCSLTRSASVSAVEHLRACNCIELAAAPQLWAVSRCDGGRGRPAAGATVTLRNVGRAGCASYAATARQQCAGERVELGSSGRFATARWMLQAGPYPGTYLLASAANRRCPRRFLGAPAGCGGAQLRLYARDDPAAQLVWRLAL